MSDTEIPLQRGLEFYYEASKEFELWNLPIEKQVAFGFEAGYQAGKTEVKGKLAMIFKPEDGMREWA